MKVNIQIHRKKELRRLNLLFFLMVMLAIFLILNFTPKVKHSDETAVSLPEQEFLPESPPIREHEETIQRGTTLSDILFAYDFSTADIHKLRQDVKPVYDLAKIRAGNKFRVFTVEDGKVQSLEYNIDNGTYLTIQKDQDSYKAEIKEFEYEIKLRMIWGKINDNLISAITEQGENDNLAISLAEIFAWDIDFNADIRKGDSFKVLFEKKYLDGQFVGYKNVIAAEFSNLGKTFQAFRYTYSDTEKSDYFDFEGNSLRKEFLISPVSFTRISSRFSFNRLHPVRKVYRPHMGVDYAATPGTPVQATADGTVTFADWNGASGRMVRIKHKKGYETMYLHLKNFAPGIRNGKQVNGGQTIGYVGSSG
ncbi:MAG: peptidoglycan DD-metalloendopeptidase family protein, partial [Candidatus Aminicenantes bacterium]|nr:peptidoglycan DD-metalloendopeptidase family protein [Candidatus Aminicenantes bacterium]